MGRHRKKRAVVPVRTGLLGASAAMAVGAVAVASGLLPGGDTFTVGGGTSGERVHAGRSPDLNAQGGSGVTASDRPSASASRSAERAPTPSKTPSPTPSKPSAPKTKQAEQPKRTKAPAPKKTAVESAAPLRTATPEKTTERPKAPSGPAAVTGRQAAAEAAVLNLVNAERATVGCAPVRASAPLASLARAFSQDMAERGFFSHTDPDGATPWDRAAKAGVEGLGAENIARGQADAEAVMESWMNSDGHRANILNCDYTTLGVGVHFGEGGPWWTQSFGF